MPRPVRVAALGAVGLLGLLVSPPTAAVAAPEAVTYRATVHGIEAGTLDVTLSCDSPEPLLDVNVAAWVTQDLEPLDATAYGYGWAEECDGDGVRLKIELPYGDSVLTPGEVAYELTLVNADRTRTTLQGVVQNDEVLDLDPTLGPGAPDVRSPLVSVHRAPAPLRAPRQPGAHGAHRHPRRLPTVRATVMCPSDQPTYVNIEGRQRVGRHYLRFADQVTCQGETTIVMPVTSPRGQLLPGRTRLALSVDAEVLWRGTIILRGFAPAPPPPAPPEPDPTNVTIDGTERVDHDTIEVTTTLTDCPAGARYSFEANAAPVTVPKLFGRWWSPTELGGRSDWRTVPCDGGDVTVTQAITGGPWTDEVDVWVWVEGAEGGGRQMRRVTLSPT